VRRFARKAPQRLVSMTLAADMERRLGFGKRAACPYSLAQPSRAKDQRSGNRYG